MTTIEWRTPSPTWTRENIIGSVALRPSIALCHSDAFLDDFLALMQGKTPQALSDALLASNRPQKLFQPAHGCYYLIVGSLVCHQLGFPDRVVSRAAGESAAFVVRRLMHDDKGAVLLSNGKPVEQAWVNDGAQRGWHTLDTPTALYDGEERLPMHHVDTCAAFKVGQNAFADAFGLSECGRRTVYYGYVPVANREKYTERRAIPAGANPAAEFQKFIESVANSGETAHDPRLEEIDTRIIGAWRSLKYDLVTGAPLPPVQRPKDKQLHTISFFLLLDIADTLSTQLPKIFAALGTDGSSLAVGSARRALFNRLHAITHINSAATGQTLTNILSDLKDMLPLVQADADASAITDAQIDTRAAVYDMTTATKPDDDTADPNDTVIVIDNSFLASPPAEQPQPPSSPPASPATLHEFFQAALAEEKAERIANNLPWLPAPSQERFDLLRDQVVPKDVTGEELYVLRTVYEHAPCCPVVSAPTGRVIFAKFYDPDAPARHIRIELPSIKPRDLRKYKRGVGLEMSPELRDLMNRVHKGMLKDDGLQGPSTDWKLGMICSFSLQIIFWSHLL